MSAEQPQVQQRRAGPQRVPDERGEESQFFDETRSTPAQLRDQLVGALR